MLRRILQRSQSTVDRSLTGQSLLEPWTPLGTNSTSIVVMERSEISKTLHESLEIELRDTCNRVIIIVITNICIGPSLSRNREVHLRDRIRLCEYRVLQSHIRWRTEPYVIDIARDGGAEYEALG
jgi:hypothetical protein